MAEGPPCRILVTRDGSLRQRAALERFGRALAALGGGGDGVDVDVDAERGVGGGAGSRSRVLPGAAHSSSTDSWDDGV